MAPADALHIVGHLAPGRVILVTGGPGTGKSTLTVALARCLNAEAHSVGQRLRDLRSAGDGWTEADEKAYLGHGPFARSTMVRALARVTQRAARVGVVLDGSIGLARAVADVGLTVVCEVRLVATEATQSRRLAARAAAGRPDDRAEIIERRLALARAVPVPSVPWPMAETPADGERHDVLAAAIETWLVLDALGDCSAPVQIHEVGSLGLIAAGRVTAPRCWRPSRAPVGRNVTSVVLVKPGLGPAIAPLAGVVAALDGWGFDCVAATVWPVTDDATPPRVLAHHGLHLVHSRWASSTLPPGSAGEAAQGYLETEEGRDPRTWRETCLHRRRSPTHPCAWTDDDPPHSVNSHVPGVISGWFVEPEGAVVALEVAARSGAEPLFARRHELVGAARPDMAPAGSLRGLAHRGLLGFRDPVTHQNNGVHCSDSPASAARERQLWALGLTATGLPGSSETKGTIRRDP